MIQLYENPGWGSAIVELQLAFYGLPFSLIPVGDVFQDPAARASLGKVNPLMQMPTLVTADGEVMTESGAITLLLADLTQSDALVPAARAADRAPFLRWMVFLVASIYPGFAYSDAPERYVPDATAETLRKSVIEHRQAMWKVMEAECTRRGGPFFLGKRMTAIDFFLACMVHWRPDEAWFVAEAPSLWHAAEIVSTLPQLATAYQRNFG